MGDIAKLAIVLTIVSSIAGLAIGFTYKNTKDKIEQQKQAAQENALSAVFPEGVSIEEKDAGSLPGPYWIGKKEDSLIGYAFKGYGKGFSSDINFMVSITRDGKILGIAILSQTETPGLGTRVEEVISDKYIWTGLFSEKEKDSPWFTKQFKGINIKKDIDISRGAEWHTLGANGQESLLEENKVTALTGATISTRAVIDGIKQFGYKYLSALKNDNIRKKEDVQTVTEQDTTIGEDL